MFRLFSMRTLSGILCASAVVSGVALFSINAADAQTSTEAPGTLVKVEGVLLEKGTKTPLSEVNIFLLPAKLKATTDAKGRFVFEQAPQGSAQLVVNHPGYLKLDRSVEVSQTPAPFRLLLEKMSYQGFEITVRARATKRDDTTRSMGKEQFLTVPGANGDPVKAVQNLPGVARVAGFSSQIVIQGSAPQDTSYLLDDNDVPLVFHFGGLTSIITPEAIEQVDYLSAGYGPEYGRAIGGLIGLKTRAPTKERAKGFAFVDITKAGALYEAPIDEKSSFLIAGRYSYLGFVLQQALKDNPRFNLTVAPSFADLAFIYDRKINENEQFKLTSIGSRDELRFVLKEPIGAAPTIRGNFSNETSFYRFIPQYSRKFSDGSIGRTSLGLGQDFISVDAGDNYFKLKTYVVSNRLEYETKNTPEWTTYYGLDSQFVRATVSLRLPNTYSNGGISNPITTGDPVELSLTQDDLVIGPYWRNTVKMEDSKWTYMPSLRLDYFSVTKELKPQPRFALRYDENEFLNYRAATGLYFQSPQPQETAANYGNPDIKAPYSWHFTVGGEKDFREGASSGFVVTANVFYRLFSNLVINSSRVIERDGAKVFEKYSNEGKGRSYGTELLVKYDAKPWSGWISYTLSQAKREEPDAPEHVFEFDQTHNINVVGAYDFENNWKVSGRARYVTGNPFTPVIGGTFDSDSDVYSPTRGPIYSERLSPFIQIDVRADKKWVYDDWILWGYLDIQNLTNTMNPEAIRYSYDFTQRQEVTGLPILPTLGVKGEF